MTRTFLVAAALLCSADALRLEKAFGRRAIASAIAAAPLAGLVQAASATRVSNAALVQGDGWREAAASNNALGKGGEAPSMPRGWNMNLEHWPRVAC